MLAGQLALIVAALFTGAAFYVGFAEQPARLTLADRDLLTEWKPSYERGYIMQATLAIVGFLLGLVAWWQTGQPLWLIGAIALVANWPYTLFIIMPTNRTLKETDPERADSGTRKLIQHWGSLHAGRTALGLLSVLMFLAVSVR